MKEKNFYSVKNVVISFVFFMFLYYLINFSSLGLAKLIEITDGHSILDMEMSGYSVDRAYEILDSLGEAGRNFDIKYIVPLDFPFPLAYGIFYFVCLSVLAKNLLQKLKRPWLIGLIGFCATLFDWLENVMIIQLLNNYPQRLENVAEIASLFTQLKSGFTMLSMLLIIIGLVGLGMKKLLRITIVI